MAIGMSEARIVLHFNIHRPIELVDLTLSFQAVAREYRRFLVAKVRDSGGKAKDADVKLYVTKIQNNCILAELGSATEIMGQMFSTINYVNIFVDFVKNFNDMVDYFRVIGNTGNIDPKALPYSKRQTDTVADIMKTVSRNSDGSLCLKVIEYGKESRDEREHLVVKFGHEEALEARRGALLANQALEYRGDSDHPNVLMYFHQANKDDPKSEGRTGFRAVIKSISDTDLPVHFISGLDQDRIKDLVDDPKQNPFTVSYRVDVNVETERNDKPRFYRVVKLHEIIPDENLDG